jgi:hypothetical protein
LVGENLLMLAPRFTIRTALGLLTAGAVIFLVAGMAVRGETWAWGITIGILSVGVAALTHAFWFGVLWLFSQLPSRDRPERSAGPAE